MPALFRRTVAVTSLAVATLLTVPLAVPPAAHAAGAESESTPVMVVLDASGSMTATDAPGSRIEAAKAAVDGLVGSVRSDAQVGLEVYGTSTGSSGAEKAAGCKDIKVLVPVGPIDKTSFTSTVDGIRASGYTPIGQSLLTAAQNLPTEGPRSIVLVSDGIDTCAPPDPCEVAKQLKAQGIDLTIHTVGFKVDAKARAQLTCIADVTGGTYRDAGDGDSLSHQLQTGVQRALQPYEAVGTQIMGSDTPADAPELEPGQYVDSYDYSDDSDGTNKFYAVTLHKGETPYLAATIIPPAIPTESQTSLDATVTLTTPDQDYECSFIETGHDFVYGRISAVTGLVSPGEVGGPDWPHACPTDGRFLVEVGRTANAFADQPLKMEIAFRIEPPADASGLPGPATPQPLVRVQPGGPVHDVSAGSSFNDAPDLEPGTYRDTIVAGEARYFKVHLDWGQRLAYLITPAKLPDLGIGDGINSTVSLASPLRADLAQPASAVNGAAYLGSTDGTLYGSTLVPARYTNRDSKQDTISPYALDGDYYLVFNAGVVSNSKPLTVPYTIAISVVGQPEPGPKYEALPTDTSSSAAPSEPAPSGVSPAADTAITQAASKDIDTSVPVAVVTGGAVAVVAAGGAITTLLIRRRGTPGH